MKLPNYESAIIAERKITEYLLSFSHRDGRSKAQFFSRFGFSAEAWDILATALRNHAAAHEVVAVEVTRFGTSFTVEGSLETPDGRTPRIRTVWFIDNDHVVPHLVTAYPAKERLP